MQKTMENDSEGKQIPLLFIFYFLQMEEKTGWGHSVRRTIDIAISSRREPGGWRWSTLCISRWSSDPRYYPRGLKFLRVFIQTL